MVNSLMMLAVEANGVVALRMLQLMRGGRRARREAELMVSEKIRAAFEATASLIAGASGDEISTACSGKCGITPYPAASKPKPKPCAQGTRRRRK